MNCYKLFIFVEGTDDERFFKHVLDPLVDFKIQYILYAQLKKKLVIRFIESLEEAGIDYIFTADLDEMPGVAAKKKYIRNKYEYDEHGQGVELDMEKIQIVVTEIESWYLAGMDEQTAEDFHVTPVDSTDALTKEMFNNLYHGRFHSRLDFMLELLNNYSIFTAKRKNKSFRYFMENIIEPAMEESGRN